MNKVDTMIVFLLDASGSMGPFRKSTVDSFNEYLTSQKAKKDKDSVTVSAFSFDSSGFGRTLENTLNLKEIFVNKDLNYVYPLTEDQYVPCGGTPLLDAVGETIDRVKTKKKTYDNKKDIDVLFVIMTDGYENSSVKYKHADIKGKIEKFSTKGWTFMYVGANQDAWAEAGKFGISYGNALNFAAADIGATGFAKLDTVTTAYRSNSLSAKSMGQRYETTSLLKDADVDSDVSKLEG